MEVEYRMGRKVGWGEGMKGSELRRGDDEKRQKIRKDGR